MGRLIDADVLKESVIRWLPKDPCGIAEKERPFETDICVSMLMEIEEAPTVDAVMVVRCKNCKHKTYCYSNVFMTNKTQSKSIYKHINFCSYGERRQT